jgi:hypothetical protein
LVPNPGQRSKQPKYIGKEIEKQVKIFFFYFTQSKTMSSMNVIKNYTDNKMEIVTYPNHGFDDQPCKICRCSTDKGRRGCTGDNSANHGRLKGDVAEGKNEKRDIHETVSIKSRTRRR